MVRWAVIVFAIALVGTTASVSLGAELLCTASSWETYVGSPVQIQVIIKDVRVYEPPTFPDITGAQVRELRPDGEEYPKVTLPVDGKDRTVTYTYLVVPHQAGSLMIPPIQVTADGELFSTSPMRIVVKKSEAGDLLYVKLLADRQYVYVGQPIDATLEIWLKPYSNRDVRMDAEDMWRYTIDEDAGRWGPFRENLQSIPRDIRYRTELRPDANGVRQRYFVYSMSRKVWPQRPGTLDAESVKVVVNYPLKMRRRQSTMLGRPYEIVESRPISAEIEDPKIVVKGPPTDGRPDTFRGAVGEYTMTITATPMEVSVGDPITLFLRISGTGRMDLLQPPLLAEQESLTVDFRVPHEDLAGTVQGTVKEFRQTIRAKHDHVDQIPAIRFSYFEPQTERYVTLKSDPIPLTVKESTRLAVSQLVDAASHAGTRTELTAAESGVLANYEELEALLSQQSLSFGAGVWGYAASGPLLFLACWLVRGRRNRIANGTGLKRRRTARAVATAAIRRAAADADGPTAASRTAQAVTGYVADRFNLPPGNVTRGDVIRQLRLHDLPEEMIRNVDSLLVECEATQYGAVAEASVEDLIGRARDCLWELQRRKL